MLTLLKIFIEENRSFLDELLIPVFKESIHSRVLIQFRERILILLIWKLFDFGQSELCWGLLNLKIGHNVVRVKIAFVLVDPRKILALYFESIRPIQKFVYRKVLVKSVNIS